MFQSCSCVFTNIPRQISVFLHTLNIFLLVTFISLSHRSLSANTLSFAALASRTEPLDSLTLSDSPVFLFTATRPTATISHSHDPLPAGRGGPVLRLVYVKCFRTTDTKR